MLAFPPDAIPEIAIAGAGFSGTLLAVQLAAHSRAPLHITLYDAYGAFARGAAYGTRDPSHLLNVSASRMGAFEDRKEDFYHWVVTHAADWRARHPELAGIDVAPGSFLPRMLYGDYIADVLQNAQKNNRHVVIETLAAQVTEAEPTEGGLSLTLADGTERTASRLVLAVGNQLTGSSGFEKKVADDPRYTGDLWHPKAGSLLTQDDFTSADAPVVIIGTGLTMVDMLLTLRRKGYEGAITAISRHGLLPQPHDASAETYPRFLPAETAPRTAIALTSRIRKEIRRAKKRGIDWRRVVDSLRPDTQALWAGLEEGERRKLLRILAYWNVHRHRMPPSSGARIAAERRAGLLAVRAGSIRGITPVDGGLQMDIRAAGGLSETITAAHVLNCAGPGMNIEASGNPLLLSLYKKGLIEKGPLAFGIAATTEQEAKGACQGRIFALGPLLMGEKFETIAVPELRQQAEALAKALLNSLPRTSAA